ncbi:g5152 [Coccomyxa viridis]|uniref:G5152 protein n=1 Tax=Coccomyxa viridis TaxID=1274662 RepID=A0ABP1FS36_9CHLO
MQGSMEEPQKVAPAPAAPTSRPEPVDFTEALLSSEKLPLDLQDDIPAGSSQATAEPGPGMHGADRQQKGTPVGSPTLPASGAANHADKSVPSTPVPRGPPTSGTPGMSTGKYQRQGGSARPSPMSTTTLGPRIHDPSVFTVTDRRVRIAESEKDVPLYVVIRKWIQNDPDSEIMPMPAHGDDLAEAKRSMAPKLPPVPRLPEEPKLETRPKEAPVTSHADEPASVEGLKRHHIQHWSDVRAQHSKRARSKINCFRSRLVALLQSAQPAPSISLNNTLSLADIPPQQQ